MKEHNAALSRTPWTADKPNTRALTQHNALKRKTYVHTHNPRGGWIFFFQFNPSNSSSKLCCSNSKVIFFQTLDRNKEHEEGNDKERNNISFKIRRMFSN
jgi:hypothetical protein